MCFVSTNNVRKAEDKELAKMNEKKQWEEMEGEGVINFPHHWEKRQFLTTKSNEEEESLFSLKSLPMLGTQDKMEFVERLTIFVLGSYFPYILLMHGGDLNLVLWV